MKRIKFNGLSLGKFNKREKLKEVFDTEDSLADNAKLLNDIIYILIDVIKSNGLTISPDVSDMIKDIDRGITPLPKYKRTKVLKRKEEVEKILRGK